jgi:hypothetical protein
LHALRTTTCAFDGDAGAGLYGGSLFDGGADVDKRRLLLTTGADGEIRYLSMCVSTTYCQLIKFYSVCGATAGVQVWRWPSFDAIVDANAKDAVNEPTHVCAANDGKNEINCSHSL